MALPVYPFDSDRCIGTVIEVTGTVARVNLPHAAAPGSRWHHGFKLEAGRVGEFVVIESGETAVFGRVTSVRLPERERLAVEEELGSRQEVHPIGVIHMMASASLVTGRVEPGVPSHPRLAARCFSAHPELVKWLAEHSKFLGNPDEAKLLDLAVLPFAPDTHIRLAPESLFGRHCAVLGATGGGKSWTVSRLVEEAAKHRSKILLIDPTGEYHTIRGGYVVHAHVNKDDAALDSVEVGLPHKHLTEEDLFALFTPSPQNQQPRLRSAIKSLKIAHFVALSDTRPEREKLTSEQWDILAKLKPYLASGNLVKSGQKRVLFDDATRAISDKLDRLGTDFAAHCIAAQVNLECCYPTDRTDATKYGDVNPSEQGYCTTLVLRVEQYVASTEHACLFRSADKVDLISKTLKDFLDDESKSLLVLSLKNLSFSSHLREIFVNAIGRTLLRLARLNKFSERPLVTILDEAHQFVGRVVGDDFSRFPLDAFELIAKEGRKYGLTLCLATQRPRDIGQSILSQMGTFLVHRLTNPEDREMVEKAAGDLDRSAASFIPTLAAGQAVLIGIDFPIPVTLQVIPPSQPPKSTGPRYQETW